MFAVLILLAVRISMMHCTALNYLMEIWKSECILQMLVTLSDQTLPLIKKLKIGKKEILRYKKMNMILTFWKCRCTTVYLVDRRTDMLPKLLTETLCSLKDDGDRLAFSVVWEIDRNANIIETRYHKSIIRSVASLSYG
jgi:RNB domain